MLHDEDDLVRSSDHESDDGSRSDDGPDIDEYANLDRDLEKYENDRVRWNGIENVRKYHIAKKKSKVEDQKKRKDNGEEEAKRTTKPRKQDKPKALPKSRRKGKRTGVDLHDLHAEFGHSRRTEQTNLYAPQF